MRRCRATIATFALTVTALLVAGPALAGGPTSVLLVVPGSGRTASLYTGNADYQKLGELVGAFDAASGTGTTDPSANGRAFGSGVTVTWLIHDVHVWRVDRIYFDGGPWIATQIVANESGVIWDKPVVWHTATRGKELAALLDRLGVSPIPHGEGPVADGPAVGSYAGTDLAAPAAAPADESKTASRRPDTAPWGQPGPVWGLAGLTLGVVLTTAALRLLGNSGDAEHELVTPEPTEDDLADVETPPTEPDSQQAWSPTEELSSLRN